MAAFNAKGKTIIKNCAVEPEVKELVFLKKLGANINFSGRTITVVEQSIKKLEINYEIMFDRIEAGTYIIASALIGKKVLINKINPEIIKKEIEILKKIGVKIKKNKASILISKNKKLKNINIVTKPYPGFPTDLQAQLMVLLTQAKGVSKIKEDIFENRFMHVPELIRMGAKIEIKNKTLISKDLQV